jgi:fructoselysine and glucoselysine-specific PTS system IIB component
LLHGQVAFIWTSSQNISMIVVANDDAANDEFLRLTLELGRPRGVQLVIDEIDNVRRMLGEECFRDENVLLIVNSIKDAIRLMDYCKDVRSINLGGLRMKPGANMITNSVALTDQEITLCKELMEQGIELEVRQVPTEKKVSLKNFIG